MPASCLEKQTFPLCNCTASSLQTRVTHSSGCTLSSKTHAALATGGSWAVGQVRLCVCMCVCANTFPFRSWWLNYQLLQVCRVTRSTTHLKVCNSNGTSESAAFNQEVNTRLHFLDSLPPLKGARSPHLPVARWGCSWVCVLLLLAVCFANEARMSSEPLISR